MDSETRSKIEATVLDILKDANMDETTEFQVRSLAAERLGLDLSVTERKRFVRQVVESFLEAKKNSGAEEPATEEDKGPEGDAEEEEEGEEEEEEDEGKKQEREYDDEGNPIICRLSNKRQVTVQDFRGKTLVSIREYYEKDGKLLPSSKGISLTAEQWEAFSQAVPKIEEAIKKLEGDD